MMTLSQALPKAAFAESLGLADAPEIGAEWEAWAERSRAAQGTAPHRVRTPSTTS